MFRYRLQKGEEVLHRCIEGKRVGDDGGKVVGIDRRHDGSPGGTPAPPEERGESPPPSSSCLASPLDGRRFSPLVHGLHGGGGAGAPPRLDLSLCFSSVSRSCVLAFHRFLNSRRSVIPIEVSF